jgi:cytochrome c oxidase cbb3-type subunit 3/ubiquinol-cytochrome c reductase cytochrome c subunit
MKSTKPLLVLCVMAAPLLVLGCKNVRGKPGPGPEVQRPEDVRDFATLYGQNCVACHGDNRQTGAGLALANPVYLAVAGESNIKNVLMHGVPGKLMPPFAKSGGGMLTEEQVDILAHGLVTVWGKPGLLDGTNPPPYKATLHPDIAAGEKGFAENCASCHGEGGKGNPDAPGTTLFGSIVDPAFLGVASDQVIRSFVIAGFPDQMPDWRSHDSGKPLSDQEITDIVAWVGSHRLIAPSTVSDVEPEPGSAVKPASAKVAKSSTSKQQEPPS